MPGDHWRFRNDLSPQGDDQAYRPPPSAQSGVPAQSEQAFTQDAPQEAAPEDK